MTITGQSPGVGERSPLLELRGISKRFGAVQALTDVDFEVLSGRGRRAGRRQRRWQVHADQDHRRDLSTRRGRDPL